MIVDGCERVYEGVYGVQFLRWDSKRDVCQFFSPNGRWVEFLDTHAGDDRWKNSIGVQSYLDQWIKS